MYKHTHRYDNVPTTPTVSLTTEPEKLVQMDYLSCYIWQWRVSHGDHIILTALLRSVPIPMFWNQIL